MLALSAHRQLITAPSTWRNRWFRDAAAFGLLIFLPTGIFFYTQWPDWSWLYYVNAAEVSTVVSILAWLAYPAAVMLGFVLTAALLRTSRPRLALVVPAIGVVTLLGVTFADHHRFLHLASYADYWLVRGAGGSMTRIFDDTLWLATMAGAGLFVGIPVVFLVVRNLRESKGGLLPPSKTA